MKQTTRLAASKMFLDNEKKYSTSEGYYVVLLCGLDFLRKLKKQCTFCKGLGGGLGGCDPSQVESVPDYGRGLELDDL